MNKKDILEKRKHKALFRRRRWTQKQLKELEKLTKRPLVINKIGER